MCVHIGLDTADIVRDGDFSLTILLSSGQLHGFH
jgi:hypothetical protein